MNTTNQNTKQQHPFLHQGNVELLWELISEEYQLTNTKTKTMQEYKMGIRNIFDTNLHAFKSKVFDQELMTLNKTFLAQINGAVRNLYPDIRKHLQKAKIKIIEPDRNNNDRTFSEPIIEPISHQDIQTKRRSEFNQRLDLQQNNLDMAMGVAQQPDEIDLSDQLPPEDKNPQSMAEQFARTLAERNYDPLPTQSNQANQAKQVRETKQSNQANQSTQVRQPKKNITIDERHNQVNEYETQPFDNGSDTDEAQDLTQDFNQDVLTQPNKFVNENENVDENNRIMDMLYTITDSLKTVMQDVKALHEKIDGL